MPHDLPRQETRRRWNDSGHGNVVGWGANLPMRLAPAWHGWDVTASQIVWWRDPLAKIGDYRSEEDRTWNNGITVYLPSDIGYNGDEGWEG